MGNLESIDTRHAEIEEEIWSAIRGIRYGSVEIIIQDSCVVQLERKEKVRFNHQASNAPKSR